MSTPPSSSTPSQTLPTATISTPPPSTPSLSAHQIASRAAHAAYDIDQWYPLLSSLTFPTFFLPLSPPTALALIHSYQTHCLSRPSLTSADNPLLSDLQSALHSLIASQYFSSGAFVRLSSRSPKDADIPPAYLHFLYLHELLCLGSEGTMSELTAEAAANRRFIAYTRARLYSLRVQTGEQAMRLLLSSERVYTDLLETQGSDGVQVVVRGWEPQLDPALEFRCFVHRRRLTCISQYAYHCTFAQLQAVREVEAVKAAIVDYWRQAVHPLLQHAAAYESYVVDMALMREDNASASQASALAYTCTLIELNPFTTATSACLFHWTADGPALRGEGKEGEDVDGGSVEVRVRTAIPHGMVDFVDAVLEEAGLDPGEESSAVSVAH